MGGKTMLPQAKLARPTAKLLEQLTHTGDGVCAVDAHQRIILWNEAASTLLGYTPAEVLGKNCYDVIQAKDCEGKIICQKDCSLMEEAKKLRWQSHHLFRTHSKNGETVWLDVTPVSVLSPQQKLSAFVLIFREAAPPPREFEISVCGRSAADASGKCASISVPINR